MRKVLIVLLIGGTFVFQFCSSSKKASKTVAATSAVTYDANIKPVILSSCSPCHIAGKGKKKPLDDYSGASASANEIIERIQKNPGEHGFMPAMHPKLSDSTIQLFMAWKNAGLPEK